MEDFKAEIFGTIQDFNTNKNQTIDWTTIWEHEEKFQVVVDSIDVLIDGTALLPDLEDLKKVHLIGRLSLIRAHFIYSYESEQQMAHFIKYGKNLELLLRDVITCSPWLTTAQQRFEDYLEIEQTITEDYPLTMKQMDHIRPILMAIAAMSIITVEDEDYTTDENEDEDESLYDDEDECGQECA